MAFMQVFGTLAIFPMIFLVPWEALACFIGAKILLDGVTAYQAAKAIDRIDLLRYYPLYPLYFFVTFSILSIYFLLPTKVDWKGRKF
jgi:hypothetical protein